MTEGQERMRAWAERLGPTTSEESPETVPAATVILLRDGPDGLETLVLLRNSKLAFAGGMWVFPGGRVDPADAEGAADALTAARTAAVREAAEEAGLVVDPDAMVVLAHWCPPAAVKKRFATWFFVGPAPEGAVTIDGGEIHEHAWVRPTDALARRDAGEIELGPPTWVTLHDLAQYATVAGALDAIGQREPEYFETRVAATEGAVIAMWHGDAGYDTGDAEAPGPRHRLRMADDAWSYERS
ncbi:MAG TPA: NUDIX domain-containing protein [Acidimicrobiia bacterium]|jgi:8-oxo-dGTP pyrophosphatase MutT (NUDIX family)|nr:NUDIX domain-containing protein [Acidimicrobiia bacterium]